MRGMRHVWRDPESPAWHPSTRADHPRAFAPPRAAPRCLGRVFAALDQRVATRYQIAPMDLAESARYLQHHLALAGRSDPLLADDAMARLHKASLGLPRALNNAAVAALIAATTAGKALVDDDCAKKAVAELTRD